MNLEQWRARRQRVEILTLPSGLEVQIKPVTMQDLLVQGKVPDTLYGAIDDMGERTKGGTNKLSDMKTRDLADMAQLTLIVCRAALVEPAELDPEELPLDDRIVIFNAANAEAIRLATFPKTGSPHGVDVASNGDGVRDAAVQPVGV